MLLRGTLTLLLPLALALAACGDKPARTADQFTTKCASTASERLERLISIVDQACGCAGDAACDEAASTRAKTWNECGLYPDPAVAEAILLDDGQIKRLFAETERLGKCNDTVHRAMVAVAE
ncbi:MAG: hypothetical protein H6711_25090 [Myxococcales bacterium]|nr:hypothetical protein [Myxococcales bacterium]